MYKPRGFGAGARRGNFPRRGSSRPGANRGMKRSSSGLAVRDDEVDDESTPSTSLAKRPRIADQDLRLPIHQLGTPIESYSSIFVSNLGLNQLCEEVWNAARNRNRHLPTNLALWKLQYVAHMRWILRLANVSSRVGKFSDDNLALLRSKLEGVILPSVICDYIEACGCFTLSTGVKVIPYYQRNRIMFGDTGSTTRARHLAGQIPWSEQFYDPRILLLTNISPEDEAQPVPVTPWAIKDTVILDYIRWSGQLDRPPIQLRKVIDSEEFNEGKSMMLVSCREDDDHVTGYSAQQLTFPELNLGAAYKFRTFTQPTTYSATWANIGHIELLYPRFTGTGIEYPGYLAELCSAVRLRTD